LRLLEGTDAALSAMHRPDAPGGDPVLIALADADERFQLPSGALAELIEGVRMDVLGTRYETFEELVGYCRRVAGAIGRVCLAIFDSRELSRDSPMALAHADDLGVALQLTNILRDIREDLANGRVYLPAEDLERFGCTLTAASISEPANARRLEQLIRFEADRARGWYATGLQLMPMLDRRSAASASAMAGIYGRLLEHIAAAPSAVLSRRLSLPAREKAMVAARSLAGMRRRPATAGSAGRPAGGRS
jgi:15-cis-phytoene synthase